MITTPVNPAGKGIVGAAGGREFPVTEIQSVQTRT
jgi:hypothetical protein